MKRLACWSVVLSLGLLGGTAVAAQEVGAWRAMSESARNTTGDLYFGGTKMSIDFTAFTIAEIRDLKPEEARGVFDVESSASGRGHLYRLDIPGSKRFVKKNTLCGSEDTQWMVTYVDGKTLQVAFFSGTDMPVLTAEGMASATDVCGTFGYQR